MFIGSLVVFFGSTLLITATNLGKRLGFLVVGAATFGWGIINSILFVLYAPRGPKPAEIEGLNAFEIRILPLTFLITKTAQVSKDLAPRNLKAQITRCSLGVLPHAIGRIRARGATLILCGDIV